MEINGAIITFSKVPGIIFPPMCRENINILYNIVGGAYLYIIAALFLKSASRPRMHFDKVFEKAARLIQDGGDGPAVRRE